MIGLPIRVLCTLWLGLLLVGCAGSPKNPPATEQVDLQRYQGTWYELARLPMFFQRNCAQSEAHYRLQEDQSIQVINRCLTLDGDWEQVEGGQSPSSRVAPTSCGCASTTGSPISSPTWRAATIGCWRWTTTTVPRWWAIRTVNTCGCCRVPPQVSQQTRERLLEEARSRGYAVDELIWRVPDGQLKRSQ